TSSRESSPPRGFVDNEDEGTLAVDLHDGEPFAVLGLEILIAADVDLLELEAQLVAERVELRARPLAEMAALGPIQDHSGDEIFAGCRHRRRRASPAGATPREARVLSEGVHGGNRVSPVRLG